MTRFALLLPLLLVTLSSGCVNKIAYQPRSDLVAERSLEDVQQLCREKMIAAREPALAEVSFQGQGINITGPFGPFFTPMARTILLNEISRFDIYENNRVFFIAGNGSEIIAFSYNSIDECKSLADIVNSLKAAPPQ